jgi:tetratricopeptide (TPR) repeat protein
VASVSRLGEPVHRTILALDIEGYTRRDRRDSDRLHLRSTLYQQLERALHRAGISTGEYQCSDLGDGVLVLFAADVPKTRILPWLILRLAAGLDRYNRSAVRRLRLRLRVVLHAGEVASDAHGYASKDLNLAFRMLDSNELRKCLAGGDSSLVLLVSQSIYDDIVRQGFHGIDPGAFKSLPVAANNMHARAWLYLPGHRNDAHPAEQPPVDDASLTQPSALAIPHELPADTPNFTGREAELDRLVATLARDRGTSPALVAIHGIGGVGKSALAIHAAHQLASRFSDGQVYVNLQGGEPGLRPLSPGELVARLLRGLGVDGRDIPVNVEEATARFRSLVAGRSILLVLDNAVSAAQVRPLLPASPSCAAIVTSRRVLTTLDGASRIHLDVLPMGQAISLLGKLCGADRLAADESATKDLARQCDYLPLALRIAGARLAARPSWPVRALTERLADERTALDELETADLAMRSCFQVGYQALNGSPDTRERTAARLFRLLGLHRGPDVGVWTVAALLNTSPAAAESALEQLVDAQLLETPARHRYRMHGLLLLFAREQAERDERQGERQAALGRMLACYLATAHRAQRLLQPTAVGGSGWSVDAPAPPLSSRAEAFAWFEEERVNLLAAARQAAHGSPPEWNFTTRLAEVMFWFLQVRSYWQDAEEINQVALRVARLRGDRHAEALALNDLGYAYGALGRLDEAANCLDQSSRIFRILKDPLWEHTALGALGAVFREQGRLEQAVDCLQRRLKYFHDFSPTGESAALNNLGLAYAGQGRFDAASDCLEQSLALCHKTQNLFGAAMANSNLGEVHYRAGRLYTAVEFYEESLHIHQEIGGRCREAETLWRLGWVRDSLGQQAQAQACRHAAEAIFRRLGVKPPAGSAFERTAWCWW